MYQFRSTNIVIVALDRPWKIDGTVAAAQVKIYAPSTDVVKVHCWTGGETFDVTAEWVGGTASTWVFSIGVGSLPSQGVWNFHAWDDTDTTYSHQYGAFEWGGNYETMVAAAALMATVNTNAATAATQSTTAATQSTTAATQATTAATQSTTAASQATTAANQATTASAHSNDARGFSQTAMFMLMNRTKMNTTTHRLEFYDDTGAIMIGYWPLLDASGNPTGALGNVYEKGLFVQLV